MLCLMLALVIPVEAGLSRREKRRQASLDHFDADSPQELEDLARKYARAKDYEEAIKHVEALRKWYRKYKPEETLLWLAGLQYEAGEPREALESIQLFGEKFPDSPKITLLVTLAYEIGKNFTVARNADYKVFGRVSRAREAFDFVNTHDPYSLEAARGLMSQALLQMKRNEWEEAMVLLKEIEHKQPATPIAAESEVLIGKCYLGMNKSSLHSREFLDQAIRYLSGYLERYPHGARRDQATKLLKDAYLRKGRKLLQVVRYYCTARKWGAAKLYSQKILEQDKLKHSHAEARDLLSYVDKKLN